MCIVIAYKMAQGLYRENVIIGETLVLAGALSNFFDRLHYGGIVDFIQISLLNRSFPVFNLADCFIVCGVVCIFFQAYTKNRFFLFKKPLVSVHK